MAKPLPSEPRPAGTARRRVMLLLLLALGLGEIAAVVWLRVHSVDAFAARP